MRIVLVGDVMLGRQVNEVLRGVSPAYPWGDTLPLFQAADVRLCNLECVLADQGMPWSATPKMFHFRSDAKNIQVLHAAQITAVSLANNHVLDFQEAALFEMLRLLDEQGIGRAGAGYTLAEASQPALVERYGQQIGLLAFTDNEPPWAATEERPGVFYVPIDRQDRRARCLFELVRQLKARVDVLIVSAHWGPNWGYLPPPAHPPFAHALIEAGADLVWGHSGHVFRGIEFYQGRAILYCLGNFIDDYAVDFVERNDESCLVSLEIEGQCLTSLRLYPTIIQDCQAAVARGDQAYTIAAKLQKLSARFNTALAWDESEGYLAWTPASQKAGSTA
jgi:poly-gamma-glutamate capsule biosynthesis protein CapA/YwtB (metallophosphatase superfamily)